jgi:hypothetical protein
MRNFELIVRDNRWFHRRPELNVSGDEPRNGERKCSRRVSSLEAKLPEESEVKINTCDVLRGS